MFGLFGLSGLVEKHIRISGDQWENLFLVSLVYLVSLVFLVDMVEIVRFVNIVKGVENGKIVINVKSIEDVENLSNAVEAWDLEIFLEPYKLPNLPNQ